MNEKKEKNDTFETIEIVKDAMVIYWDKGKELFDTIQITNKGVITGRILKIDKKARVCVNCHEMFVESGFIPRDNIIRIEGGTIRKIYKQKS